MASDPEDLMQASKAQQELRRQLRHCRLIVQNGRQLFMLAQARPAAKSD
jgi:hypothetical protein